MSRDYPDTHKPILRRTGIMLLVVALLAGVAVIRWLPAVWPYLTPGAAIMLLAGIFLLTGSLRAALWMRSVAVFLAAGGVTALIVAPLVQPLDLTITAIRLYPRVFGIAAAVAVAVLALLVWLALDLGRPPVQEAIANAHIRRWGARTPAQLGSAVVLVAGLLLWLTLHGRTADLAETLASQQLGPNYRYHLSWLSYSTNGQMTSVRGVVVAWNHAEIKYVLLHWETR